MPFGTIIGSILNQIFEPRSPGLYARASASFADPKDEFRLSGASTKRDGSRSGAITRLLQIDVTTPGGIVRKQAVLTLNISVPSDGSVTSAMVNSMVEDVSLFVTETTVSRLLQGEA